MEISSQTPPSQTPPSQTPPSFWRDASRYGFFRAIRKRWFRFRIGDRKYRYRQLWSTSVPELQEIANWAATMGDRDQVCWIFEAMAGQLGVTQGWQTVWGCMAHLKDPDASKLLTALLRVFEDTDALLQVCTNDVRCCYLLGILYLERAEKYQHKDMLDLEHNRDIALKFLGRARELAALQPAQAVSGGAPYRPEMYPNPYFELVGPTYEKAMYLQYVSPVPAKQKRNQSSSSAGGGGG